MTWYVNDLSICAQYADSKDFLSDLDALMRVRMKFTDLEHQLFCSRTLHTRLVTPNLSFREAVKSAPKNVVQLVLAWLTKNGPFWEDLRTSNEDDYFEYEGEDVTDLGLGEAARRKILGLDANCFSFANGGFDHSPIKIQHGLSESPFGHIPVPNIWDISTLHQRVLSSAPTPTNWIQMLELAQSRFDKLFLHSNIIDALKKETFSHYVVERIFVLLGVLQEFMDCRHDDGSYSDRNHELIAQHFSGKKAWFTDESETNIQNFSADMSFPDPENEGKKVLCSWHGKIKTPQYRIHFEWPVDQREKLRIFYIGPKITKS